MKRKLAVSENFIISVNMCHCQSIIVVTCITTRNICNIRNSSFQGNIEELAMIKVFLVLSLVAIWSMSLQVIYCYLNFSDHNGSITAPANLHFDWCISQISSVTPAKPALVYTSIHSTVTARYSCSDSLRLDSTCGRSGSLVVRREWAHRPWDQVSQ